MLMHKKKIFAPQLLVFLCLFVIILGDQDIYRYQEVFNIGTNFRVMDIIFLFFLYTQTIFLSFVAKRGKIKLINKNNRFVFISLSLYILVGLIAVVRGYLISGFYAIGLARYSFEEVFLIFIILTTLNSDENLRVYLRFISVLIFLIWTIHFMYNIRELPFLLYGDTNARFITSATTFGLANMSVMLLPFLLQKASKNHYFDGIPLFAIISISFLLVVLFQHRSVWLATISGFLVLIPLFIKRRHKTKIFFRLALFSLIIIITVSRFDLILTGGKFVPEVLAKKVNFLREGVESDPTGYWRVRGWNYVINRTIEKNLFFGFGFSESGWFDWRSQKWIGVWEHNQYIHIFRATGIIGLVLYLLFLITVIRFWLKTVSELKCEKLRTVAIGAGAGIVMNIIYMLFYNQVSFLWINIGILLVVHNLERKRISKLTIKFIV